MRQIKLTLSASFDFTQAETIIDQALGEARLTVTFKTTLRQFPGCIHWHVKRGNEKGTLEITVWPKQQRIWFSVHENRDGAWIEEIAHRLKTKLENP